MKVSRGLCRERVGDRWCIDHVPDYFYCCIRLLTPCQSRCSFGIPLWLVSRRSASSGACRMTRTILADSHHEGIRAAESQLDIHQLGCFSQNSRSSLTRSNYSGVSCRAVRTPSDSFVSLPRRSPFQARSEEIDLSTIQSIVMEMTPQ